jgi:phosphohistidine phosphatase
MKILYLLRHAKSSWAEEGAEDFARPLSARGRRAAPTMADYMVAQHYHPDLILCSPAARTRETLALMQKQLGSGASAQFDRRLYLATADELLRLLQAVRQDVGSLLLIGHNPGLERLAANLAGRGKRELLAELQRKYPTAALAVLAFDVARWKEIGEAAGELRDFMTPGRLADGR